MPIKDPKLKKEAFIAPQIFTSLKQQILDLTLPPLTPLSRNDLAKQFNASLMPVRDAIMALEEEGLVEIFPQYVTRVSPINIENAQEVLIFRRAIECEIIQLICGKVSEIFINDCEKSISKLEKLLAEQNMQDFMKEDNHFHSLFFKEAKIEGLYHLLSRKSGHIERLRRLHLPNNGKALAIISDHKAILAGLKNNDKSASLLATRNHLMGTLSQAENLKALYPHYFS